LHAHCRTCCSDYTVCQIANSAETLQWGTVGEVVDLVSNALRKKLLDHGARSLSEAEWHLLRVSHLLNSIEDTTFDRLLADSPLAELLALADGLDAIRAPEAARSIRGAATTLAAANDPGHGLERSDAVASIAKALGRHLGHMRPGVEEQLLDYAFRQRELTPGDPAISGS
jgi:hypothetical protein